MKFSLKQQLAIMAGIAVISVILLALVSHLLAKNTAIGSRQSQIISDADELRADILPPPFFLIEAMMHTEHLTSATPSERVPRVEEIKRRLNEFSVRQQHWLKNVNLPSAMKAYISTEMIPISDQFMKITTTEVIPAALNGEEFQLRQSLGELTSVYEKHRHTINQLVIMADVFAASERKHAVSLVSSFQSLLYGVALLAIFMVLFCSYFFSKQIIKSLGADPSELQRVANAVAGGELDVKLPDIDNSNSVVAAMKHMLAFIKEGMSQASENYRIKQALDNTSTNVIMADVDHNIIYLNTAMKNFFRETERDIRGSLPSFSAEKVVGSSINYLHSKSNDRALSPDTFSSKQVLNMCLGGRTLRVIANPIVGENGARLGSVVEWIDRTKDVAAEKEVTKILSALDASASNLMLVDEYSVVAYINNTMKSFLSRVEVDFKRELQGFSVSALVGMKFDIFDGAFKGALLHLENLNSTLIKDIFLGGRYLRLTLNPIRDSVGTSLGTVIEWLDRTQEVAVEIEIGELVEKAAAGNFNARIDEHGKENFFLSLAKNLNILVDTADKSLSDVARVLGSIAKGDLTEKIEADYAGTFGDLKNYCNETTENLCSVIEEIRVAADTILSASSEIATGNADLSRRTEQQASNLEETASSMEELTSTVKLNAGNAKQANFLAEKASDVATEGGDLIQEVVKTMSAINESSQKIADIISVIDGIAFQTNILALNAAVEAARAGDQGRGFAVVAAEVRTLAQRSANAAKDIKNLISDSVKKIESGNVLVNKSGDTMKDIVVAIKRVNDIMTDIAAASTEQTTGIEEVSAAVSQMDEMTQQNASLVEQSAASAESLRARADQLTQRVSMFKLSNSLTNNLQAISPAASVRTTANKKAIAALPLRQEDEWNSF